MQATVLQWCCAEWTAVHGIITGSIFWKDWSRPWSRRDTAGKKSMPIWSRQGGIRVTKTHGRRSVAGLNQMDNCLWKIPALVKKGQLFQPVHCHEVNRERCRMAGYEGYQYPVQCFKADMERMVAGRQDELASFYDTILQQS